MGVPRRIRELFSALDRDNSGSIEASELDGVLLGLGVSDAGLRAQMVRSGKGKGEMREKEMREMYMWDQ